MPTLRPLHSGDDYPQSFWTQHPFSNFCYYLDFIKHENASGLANIVCQCLLQTNAVLDYSKRMIELFGLKEQGTGVKERDLQKQVLLKVLSCGLERSLSISAPQIPLGSKRLELWVDPGLQILVV